LVKLYKPVRPLNVQVKNMEFTAIIRKGEKQFVALCPEVDVVSQGVTIEKAISNLREAVALYVEEMGLPDEFKGKETLVATFNLKENAKAA
jgi:predicted RNase H-like HicB family nuclease